MSDTQSESTQHGLPASSRSRRAAMVILTIVAVVVDGLAALMLHATLGEGPIADSTKRWLATKDLALPAAVGAGLLAGVVTLAAYAATLDWKQRRRPWWLLAPLGFGIGVVVLAPLLGAFKFPAEEPVVFGPAILIAGLGLFVLWLLEFVLGSTLGGPAGLAAAAGSPGAAWWGRQVLRFLPGSLAGRRALGLGLAKSGGLAEARPHLLEAYSLGDRTVPVIAALAQAAEHCGEPATALVHLDELAGLLPEDDNVLADRIRMNRTLSRPAVARELIDALPDARRVPWRETRIELLWELADGDALRKEARLFETEQGPPFPRARDFLAKLRIVEPESLDLLMEQIRLADLSGDTESLVGFLREAMAKFPENADHKRKLRRELLQQGNTAEATALLTEVAALGQATTEEHLEIAEAYAARGEYDEMMRHLEAESRAPLRMPKGIALLVRSRFEAGRHEEALAAAEEGRAGGWLIGAPAEEVAVIESRIRSQALSSEIDALGRQAAVTPDDVDLQLRYMDRLTEAGYTDKVVLFADQLRQRLGPDFHQRLEDEIVRLSKQARHGLSARLIEYAGDLQLQRAGYDEALMNYRSASAHSMRPDAALLEMANRILKSNPEHLASHIVVAGLQLKAGDARAALRHVDAAREQGATPEQIADLAGIEFEAAARTGATQRAITVGEAMITRPEYDDNVSLNLQLAELLVTQGNFNRAVTILRALHNRHPENMAIRSRMRTTLERRKVARIESLKAELAASPNSPELLEELGDLLLADDRLNEAVVEFQRAALTSRERRKARAKLGYCLALKGLHDESDEAFSETDISPGLAPEELDALKDLFFEAAQIMERDRESDRALKLLKRISRVDMGYKDVMARIERLSRSQKRRNAL